MTGTGSSGIFTVFGFMESAKKAEEIESIPGLNERQKQAIRYLREAQRISPKEYIELTGASESTAFRDLRDLVDRGILWGFGKTRDRHYRLVDRE